VGNKNGEKYKLMKSTSGEKFHRFIVRGENGPQTFLEFNKIILYPFMSMSAKVDVLQLLSASSQTF